jgi:hypothetical protein
METRSFEAEILEEAVCASKDKQLHVHCNAVSGRGWVEVSGRRFVGKGYVQAARHLHANEALELKHKHDGGEVYELGHHVCARQVAR